MIRSIVAVIASLFAAACSLPPTAAVQPAAVPLDYLPALKGDYFPLQSKEAGHLYHIYVRLPEGYAENPERSYPVVYLLDGDSLFPQLSAQHLFMTIDDKLPEAVIVGISYGSFAKPTNRRHVDFMPPGPEVKAEDTKMEAFNRFLERELLPLVESRYRAAPDRRILFGQSRGGAMILYSAFTRPDLFWARIASNPSWVPGREVFYGRPAPGKRDDLQLLVAIGTEEYPERRAAASEWFAHWNGRSRPWAITRIDIPGGTHSADAGNAYRAALRRLFAGPAAVPSN